MHQQQHPSHASGPVSEAHQEEKQQCHEGGMACPLHQQGHTGEKYGP